MNIRKYLLIIFFLATSPVVNAGGTIGGSGGGSVQAQEDAMALLQSAAFSGDLIRYTDPGLDPVYLRPDPLSVKERSLTAKALPSGETTFFYVPSEGQTIQNKLGIDFARVLRMNVAPGVLPVLPQEVVAKPKPSIEVVKMHEIDAETAEKIFRNESSISTSGGEDSTN